MPTTPDQSIIQNILVSDIVKYLHYKAWKSVNPYKKGIQVFQGPSSLSGDPLEIVLPTDEQAYDRGMYIQSALHLLSALDDQTPEEMARQIRGYERDVLRIRNLQTGIHGSINLVLAATQIPNIKSLLSYAACSEGAPPRPHYQEISRRATQIVKHFDFAHTFHGSFGFTIESIVGDQQELPLFSHSEPLERPSYIIPPIERRIMERIVRGLISLQQSLIHNDPLLIVREYSSGFNANMCRAILNMSDRHKSSMEYDIQWSPKIRPSDDIAHCGPITLDSDSYIYLSTALGELRRFPPQDISIIGNITGLIAKDDPMGSIETPRLVMIKGLKKDGSAISVAVMLSIEDYVLAHDAHLNWRFIEISGELTRVGNAWQLSKYHNFRVLPNKSEPMSLI